MIKQLKVTFIALTMISMFVLSSCSNNTKEEVIDNTNKNVNVKKQNPKK